MVNKLVVGTFCLTMISCSAPTIHGIVLDHEGNPVEGARVSIVNSQFEDFTDSDGEYGVEFVPGNLLVKYSKENFIDDSVLVDISMKDDYPAAPKTLVAYPNERDIDRLMSETNKRHATRTLYTGSFMYDKKFVNVRDKFGCGQACKANKKLIDDYRKLENMGLVTITSNVRKGGNYLNSIDRYYYTVQVTPPYQSLVIRTDKARGPCNCVDHWDWEERYQYSVVRVASLKLDSVVSTEMDGQKRECKVNYHVVADSTNGFGEYFGVRNGPFGNDQMRLKLFEGKWVAM